MRPGAPPKSCVYLYTSPGEVSSLVFEPPGTPVTPRYSQKESISRSFTCHELKVGARTPAERKQLCKQSKTGIIGLLSLSTLKTLAERMLKPAALRLLASCLFSLPRMSKPALQPGAAEKKWIGRKSHNHCFLLVEMGLKGCPKTGISTENILIKYDKAFEGSKS